MMLALEAVGCDNPSMTGQVQTMAPPSNALALAALVLGILTNAYAFLIGLLNGFGSPLALILFVWLPTLLPGILAVIFGFVGVTTANRLGGKRRPFAIWGIVLGFTPVLVFLVASFIHGALGGR